MAQLFSNNAASTLAAGITASDVTIYLSPGTGALFPSPSAADFFTVTIFDVIGGKEANHEIVKVTARTGDSLSVTRAQEGTTAKSFAVGAPVELRLSADTLNRLASKITVSATAPGFPKSGDVWIAI